MLSYNELFSAGTTLPGQVKKHIPFTEAATASRRHRTLKWKAAFRSIQVSFLTTLPSLHTS